ncbi:MAG: hypothetical protein EOO43_20610 [Flavobacterium sp.]|nr:MAG: hypothetical protein EOO43_20610 [Flavobacterium sp.]
MYCAILHADGRRWTKEYEITDYLQGLNNFILNDKLLIDDIIKSEIKNYKSEDPFNVLGFIRNQDFVKWQENVLKFREEKGYRKLNFALMRFVVKGFQPIKECRFERLPANTQFIFWWETMEVANLLYSNLLR